MKHHIVLEVHSFYPRVLESLPLPTRRVPSTQGRSSAPRCEATPVARVRCEHLCCVAYSDADRLCSERILESIQPRTSASPPTEQPNVRPRNPPAQLAARTLDNTADSNSRHYLVYQYSIDNVRRNRTGSHNFLTRE